MGGEARQGRLRGPRGAAAPEGRGRGASGWRASGCWSAASPATATRSAAGGEVAGEVTSGVLSPSLGEGIGMAYLPRRRREAGHAHRGRHPRPGGSRRDRCGRPSTRRAASAREARRPVAPVSDTVVITTDDLEPAVRLRAGFEDAGFRVELLASGESLERRRRAPGPRGHHRPPARGPRARPDRRRPTRAAASPSLGLLEPTETPGRELCRQLGVAECFAKPIDVEEVVLVGRRLVERERLREITGIIGETEVMEEVLERVVQIASVDSTVLVQGESGTGKELVARGIHALSSRRHRTFIAVNVAALPETLLESELFGHEKGAFTGAASLRKGLFELAHGGTVFLDEIGEMPLATQTKLLRVLEEREFRRVGGEDLIRVDVRVVAATNRGLREQVEVGEFRRDLYHRLNVLRIELPPLRERREDIPRLIDEFIREFSREHERTVPRHRARGAPAPRRLPLAGQRPRAAQPRRVDGRPRPRAHHPPRGHPPGGAQPLRLPPPRPHPPPRPRRRRAPGPPGAGVHPPHPLRPQDGRGGPAPRARDRFRDRGHGAARSPPCSPLPPSALPAEPAARPAPGGAPPRRRRLPARHDHAGHRARGHRRSPSATWTATAARPPRCSASASARSTARSRSTSWTRGSDESCGRTVDPATSHSRPGVEGRPEGIRFSPLPHQRPHVSRSSSMPSPECAETAITCSGVHPQLLRDLLAAFGRPPAAAQLVRLGEHEERRPAQLRQVLHRPQVVLASGPCRMSTSCTTPAQRRAAPQEAVDQRLPLLPAPPPAPARSRSPAGPPGRTPPGRRSTR